MMFSDLSKRKNTISRSFSINSELVIYPPERKPPAVLKLTAGGDAHGLTTRQQTAKDANDAADKQETNGQQQQGLSDNGGTHVTDIGQSGSGHLTEGGQQGTHSRSLCSLKTFLLFTNFCRVYIPYGAAIKPILR